MTLLQIANSPAIILRWNRQKHPNWQVGAESRASAAGKPPPVAWKSSRLSRHSNLQKSWTMR